MTGTAAGLSLMFAASLIGVPMMLRYAGRSWSAAICGGFLALGLCFLGAMLAMRAAERYAPSLEHLSWAGGIALLAAVIWFFSRRA